MATSTRENIGRTIALSRSIALGENGNPIIPLELMVLSGGEVAKEGKVSQMQVFEKAKSEAAALDEQYRSATGVDAGAKGKIIKDRAEAIHLRDALHSKLPLWAKIWEAIPEKVKPQPISPARR